MNDPADATAIKIGQLYIDINKKMKTEFTNELDRIKEFEKEQEIRGIHCIGYFYLLFKIHVLIRFRITRT